VPAARRERSDEQSRELTAQRLLQPEKRRRAGSQGLSQNGAMLEKKFVPSLALRKRGVVHGCLGIGRRAGPD
jgi:hypothetical protein